MTISTIRHTASRLIPALLVGGAILSLSACGDSSVTRGRLERSLPQTFANLYVKQAKFLGHDGVTVESLQARASCDKGGPKAPDHGPGADWTCLMSWKDPSVPLPDGTGKFELNVHSNDCYTASGPTKLIGLLTIADTHGNDVPNPVFEFDACFNPKGSSALIPPATAPATLTLPIGRITPDPTGQVAPELRCSTGADGGCAGVLTATIGPQTIGTLRYALAPHGTNTFPFSVSRAEAAGGDKLVLTVAPLIGTARVRSTALSLSPR